METCEKGTECREGVDKWMETEVNKLWQTAYESIRSTIEATTITTTTAIDDSWIAKVQCEVDFPCCEYSEGYMTNLKTNIKTNRSELSVLYEKWNNME